MEDTISARPHRSDQRRTATTRLLDAAIDELAAGGMRGLTHRRVERRAGLAQGSAKYYFGSLDALIQAVLAHLADADLPWVLEVSRDEREALQAGGDPSAVLQRSRAVIEAVMARPTHVQARLHLFVHAAAHPHLQPLVAAARDAFVERIAQSLPSGPGTEAGARFVCAAIDGMLLDQLSAPSPVVDAYAAHYLLAAGRAGADLAGVTPETPTAG